MLPRRRSCRWPALVAVLALCAGSGEPQADEGEPRDGANGRSAQADDDAAETPDESSNSSGDPERDLDALLRDAEPSAPPAASKPADSARGSVDRGRADPPREGSSPSTVRLPLEAFRLLWERARQTDQREPTGRLPPPVVLGASRYDGRATRGALVLGVTLDVTLSRPGTWKTVPLAGRRVVLRRAETSDGRPISTTIRRGYHVWVTQRTGALSLRLELLVPAGGPRGSLEYDFNVARTAVTRFECSFPGVGIEPRVDGAVSTTLVTERGGGTHLEATLKPTTRVRLVALRDLGDTSAEQPRVYAESLGLLSVEESSLELFTVIRYTILYAGVREFQLLVPRGVTLLSAEGSGAFRYTLEQRAEETLIKGETALPMHNSFELSLRLRRERPGAFRRGASDAFQVPLPRCLGVERELGWLAVEVPGKLRLEEQLRDQVQSLDVRQLPPELVRSAVSPILRAYRYHDPRRSLRLSARRLPEQQTAEEGIDRVRAFTVLSAEGAALTELRLTLRNRVRRSLSLRVPPAARVRSVLIDGRPVRPSLGADGALVLPLERSATMAGRLSPVTLQVILEEQGRAPRWGGRLRVALPRVSLPAASLAWSVFVPGGSIYGHLAGGAPQPLVGHASWRHPSGETTTSSAPPDAEVELAADAGAVPVRIKLPRTGIRLEHERYWIGDDEPVSVSFLFLERRLIYPMLALTVLLLALGLACAGTPTRSLWTRGAGGALALAAAVPALKLGGLVAPLAGLVIGLGLVGHGRRWPRRTREALAGWAGSLPQRWRERPRDAPRSAGQRVRRVMLAGALVLAAALLLAGLAGIALQLRSPLGG